jgi:probable phosphoglycerate mutase
MQTAGAIAAGRDGQPVITDDRVGECRYGDWTGRPLKKLAHEQLWRVVQAHPSAVTFPGPGGESMPDMQHRALAAVRDWNARLGRDATYLICSHGDVIKAIVADSLGLHLDQYQRIQADPCSLTVIRYTPLRPFLIRMNDRGGGVDDLMPRAEQRSRGTHGAAASDAVVGGGSGGAEHNGQVDAVTGMAGPKAIRAEAHPSVPSCRQESADTRE